MEGKEKTVVILLSGNGSNCQAIVDAAQQGNVNANIAAVISNKANALGLSRAQEAGIATFHIEKESALQQKLKHLAPDLIVLAGYMKVLSPEFVQCFAGKILNIHPSLLPKYSGLNTHQRALDAGDTEHGVTIHFVDATLDGGPIVAQIAFDIEPSDTVASLHKKAQHHEHQLYPEIIELFLSGRLHLNQDGTHAVIDEQVI
jgi:phosphoribosylglycinamide formyltransferase-1